MRRRKALLALIILLTLIGAVVAIPSSASETPLNGNLSAAPAHGMGCILEKNPERFPAVPLINLPKASSLPASVDLSHELPPVGDQGIQGSCVAWAVSYYYKTFQEKKEHPEWDISDPRYQMSPSFVYNQINFGRDTGSSVTHAMELIQGTGDTSLESFPYNVQDYLNQPDQRLRENAYEFHGASGAMRLWDPWEPGWDLDRIKQWLAGGDPCVISMPVHLNFYFLTGPDAFIDEPFGGVVGSHAVALVGYDDNAGGGRGGFKIVNSWGTDWGDDGFCYLSYDFVQSNVYSAWVMTDWMDNGLPHIGFVSDDYGAPGDSIAIEGYNFGPEQGSGTVLLNDDVIPVEGWSDNAIQAVIPDGAGTGELKVLVPSGASNTRHFVVGTGSFFANGGFERGDLGRWATGGGLEGSPTVVTTSPWERVRRGAWSAKQGYISGELKAGESYLYQQLSIGEGYETDLEFWYFLQSLSWSTDAVRVVARDTDEVWLCDLFATTARTGWQRVRLSLAGLQGRDIRIYFEVDLGGDYFTTAWFDDVVLIRHGGSAPIPGVISFTPSYAVQNTAIEAAAVTGSGFQPGATVSLRRGATTIEGAGVTVTSSTSIICRFDLAGAPLGRYDVVVRNSSGMEGTLYEGFSVTDLCGGGAGASIALFCLFTGLLSVAGAAGWRGRCARRAD